MWTGRRISGLCLGLAVVVGLGGCGNKPSKDQCGKLLEHLIDLEIKAGGASSTAMTPEMKDSLETQRKQVIEANSEKYISTCTSKTPKHVVECQLVAPNLDEVAKCE
jgi:hypothetical protein